MEPADAEQKEFGLAMYDHVLRQFTRRGALLFRNLSSVPQASRASIRAVARDSGPR